MTVEEKKKAVEEFLQKQDGDQAEPVEVPEEKVEEKATVPAPFAGRYKSDTGLFSGAFEGNVDLPEPLAEEPPPSAPTPTPPIPPPEPPYDSQISELLAIQIQNQAISIGNQDRIIEGQNKVIENQVMDRIEYERNNPLIEDSPIYDFEEVTLDPGFQVIFTLVVPEGSVMFFELFGITYNVDSTYGLTIDGLVFPTLTDVVQDFADFGTIFRPPRLVYSSIVITALNNGVIPEAYAVFIRGWLRQTIKTSKEYLGSR